MSSAPEPGASSPDPRSHYRRAREEAAREHADLDARLRRVSRLRAVTFLLTAVPLLLLETTDRDLWGALLVWAGIALVAFVALVRRHRRLRHEAKRWALRRQMAREGEARLDRDWERLPPTRVPAPPDDHPSSADLDLLGPTSLFRLINRATTSPGRALLRRWLLEPLEPTPDSAEELLEPAGGSWDDRNAPPPEPSEWRRRVQARQDEVRRLAADTGHREALELAGREVGGRESPARVRAFLRWAGEGPWLPEHRWVRPLGSFLALFTPLTTAGWFVGWLPGLLPLLGAIGALGLQRFMGGEAHRRMDAAEGGEGALERWTALFQLLDETPGAPGALRALRRISDTAGVRRSSLAHFPLVALFAWDVHMLAWLEGWQRRHGHSVEGWLLALARAEALASLGGLLHDHPDWTFPEFEDGEGGIEAREMGHPLLPPGECVPNDVEVPAPGSLLLITGSNMAGKTTLLRALGTNQVLALMGGPVAARAFHTRPMEPWTAMRIRDSLAEGVSYFLAELKRLRRLVDAARGAPVLFLLDEILQGTNTAERRTAARIVLGHLLDTSSVGAVTTHDLTLADHPDLQPRLVQVHFREEVKEVEGRKALDFDYRLREGPATSRNALLLLEIVGLGPETDDLPPQDGGEGASEVS